jgi:cell division transport system ATP-binding protein
MDELPTILKLRKVTKNFGSIRALEDVSFDVKNGEFVFLTGPSGAGKTTLLRMILRELKPDVGEIMLGDVDVTKLKNKDIPKLRRRVGVVFQDFKILPEKTVRENVEIALAVIGLPKKDWSARVERVLELVNLQERMDLFPSQLSGGELQRVSLARALVVNPKVILADEPTGNLDWETAGKIMQLFEQINKEGKTILMATHHKLIVEKMHKRVIEIIDGKVTKGGIKSDELQKEKQEPLDSDSDEEDEDLAINDQEDSKKKSSSKKEK